MFVIDCTIKALLMTSLVQTLAVYVIWEAMQVRLDVIVVVDVIESISCKYGPTLVVKSTIYKIKIK